MMDLHDLAESGRRQGREREIRRFQSRNTNRGDVGAVEVSIEKHKLLRERKNETKFNEGEKGRRHQLVIAVALSSDLVLMVLDASKSKGHRQIVTKELETVGLRLNKTSTGRKEKSWMKMVGFGWSKMNQEKLYF
ncbi:unnamed protein product [Eruca vesicaria subsp. sativa]|uniref:Uncharacterized protein n=1 Tax=Eruca vesicaria subsp. sativa TaxID=29727 RepID=A0ABC8IQX8_ERUVS|nr:unnamed protein product [Eruca vesicaria subsp. sativa]